MPDKPRHRSGYSLEELEQLKAACPTVAVTLSAYPDDVGILGGPVPALLFDGARGDEGDDDDLRASSRVNVERAARLAGTAQWGLRAPPTGVQGGVPGWLPDGVTPAQRDAWPMSSTTFPKFATPIVREIPRPAPDPSGSGSDW